MRPVGVLAALAVAVPLTIGSVLAVTTGSDGGSEVVFTFSDPDIVESSGLVVRGGRFVTVNDSGDTGRVFTVDRSGDTVGTTGWGDAVDVEAVAPWGPGEVLVGDIGDNLGTRASVELVVVPVGHGDRQAEATTYEVVYPRGPQDAETLMVHPRSRQVVVVTKGIFGGDVLVPRGPLREDRPNRLRRVGTALGVATDGAFFPDGRHLVVRDYTRAVVYAWPSLRRVAGFDLPAQPQGEGIAVDPQGRVFVSTEGARSEVRRVDLPARVRRAVAPPPPDPPDPTPTAVPDVGPDVGPDAGPAGPDAGPVLEEGDRPVWPWAVGGLVGLAGLAVLVRSLRPR